LGQDYGGNTDKPTWLYCNYDVLDEIDKYKTGPGPEYGTTSLVNRYTNKHGVAKWNGGKELKGSQEYTKDFAMAVKKLVTKNEVKVRRHRQALRKASRHTKAVMRRDPELWKDAGLWEVMNHLTSTTAGSSLARLSQL